ncbi:hypothetical protein [Nitrososphaera sp.]|uniref:hypothetical protein n=1 Tax=Nitrososphaera sp. TaxID=1971748 RepID=UPI0017F082B4|nr:hypothetical protein [Nitrososphaera sp.]NWG37818.1 hypothetical protein [Nitrososphaera sp.]
MNTSGPELIATAAALNRSSREMQISEREDLFRVFLWNNVGRKDELTVPEAIAEGAEYCDVSPATIEARWLPKATSRLSPFIVLPGTRGNSPTLIIKLRPRWKPVDNERGRKDRELMLLRQEREAQNIAKSLQEREAEVMDKEAAQRVAEHHKRDKFALIDALKAKGMSDDEITKILQDAANSQRGSQ